MEKLFDDTFCPTVSEGLSMCLQLSVHHKPQHYKNIFSFNSSFLIPSSLGAVIQYHPISEAEIYCICIEEQGETGEKRRFYTK